jgi:hypothetical protein
MDMADGNFTTNHTLLGKKNGSEHDDKMTDLFSP